MKLFGCEKSPFWFQYISKSNKMSSSDTLIFANVLFRHGDRNIAKPYPNDPYKDEIHWPEGFAQLTKVGVQRQFRLGQFLRRRYNFILGDKYNANKVYIQSSDFDRTLMSAQANLAGLFFPTDMEKWSDEILWQPIPVHTIPRNQDAVIAIETDNTYFDLVAENRKQSEKVKSIFALHAKTIAHWSKMSGARLENTEDIYWLYNTLDIEKEQNKKIPEWAEDAIKVGGIMEYIAQLDFTMYANQHDLALIASGPFLKEVIDHFIDKVQGNLKPDRSLWLYSGHDFSIFNALNSLGMMNTLHIPPYASSLHFELYQRENNEHYVQMFYRRFEEEELAPMNIPGFGEKCPLNDFRELCDGVSCPFK